MNNQYIVVYRKRDSGTEMQEITSNLEQTLAILIAQGYIIIDIIDL